MGDYITPVIESIKCFSHFAAPHLGYVWNCKSKFENLKEQLDKLQQRRNLMQSRIEQAKNNGDDIEEEVAKWLDRVNAEIDKVEQVINEYEGAEMKCLNSKCHHGPNVVKRYQHGKKAVKKANDVLKLLAEENFDQISYPSKLQRTWLSSEDYEELESRTSILNDVMDALSRSDVTMVGIHGMGGLGKTTLARKVCEKSVKNKQLFEYVVFAEVSQQPDDKKIHEIQGLIAGSLSLMLKNDDPIAVRAAKLCERLTTGNKILLILDDVWETLPWKRIGIPLKDDNFKGCKILFTARNVDVLRKIGCGINFPIATLNDEETLKLFMKMAEPGVEDHRIETLASDVAQRCFGLPVAIVTVAKALKNKPLPDWENALWELQNPSPEYQEDSVAHEAYYCIEFSFKALKSDMLESVLLLCCAMASISNHSVADLLRYCLSLNLFRDIKTVDDARMRLNISIQKLKDSSLLLGTYDDRVFSIHDIVRDVGRKIALKKQKYLIAGDVRELPQNKHFQNFTSIFLVDISRVPNKLDCPKVTFLHLKAKSEVKVPHEFFEQMQDLEVVKLEGMNLLELPASIFALAKLRALILESCSLGNISAIGNMTTLEILDLFDSQSENNILPEEIGKLNELRLLDVRESSFAVPPSIISRLTELEELYLEDWYDEGQVESSGARLEASKKLGKLTTLHMCVANAKALPNSIDFQKLKRYRILIGDQDVTKWCYPSRTLKLLVLVSDTNICSKDGLIKQLKDMEELVLDGKQAIKNILCQLDRKGFSKLKYLTVANNPNIDCVVESMSTPTADAFPSLETLCLTDLLRLETICPIQIGAKSFCQMKKIRINGCHQLKNIFPLSIAKQLLLLEEIEVENCSNIEEIFTANKAENEDNSPVSLQQLHTLTMKKLPRLKAICTRTEAASTSNACREIVLENQLDSSSLFEGKVIFPNLKNLTLEDINFKSIWPIQFSCCWVKNVIRMDIKMCSSLKYIFPSSTCSCFQRLEHLHINDCQALEELVTVDNKSSSCVEFLSLYKLHIFTSPALKSFIFAEKCSFPNLKEIKLSSLKKLKKIWQSNEVEEMTKLSQVNINWCENLEYIFPASLTRNLSQLEVLEVDRCGVKEIVAGDGTEGLVKLSFPKLSRFSLRNLEQLICFYPKKHEIEFPKLKKLVVESCEKMVDFFSFLKQGANDPTLQESQVFSSLEKMILHESELASVCSSSVFEILNHFPRLKYLQVNWLRSDALLDSVLERFHFVEELELICCSIREMFPSSEVGKQAVLNEVPPSSSFKNLKILKISYCWDMMNLMSVSSAMRLAVLEELTIKSCRKVTHIIKDGEDGDEEEEIAFGRLKILKFENLENLLIFYDGKRSFNFPSLEKLEVAKCPNLMGFSSGTFTIPSFQELVLKGKAFDDDTTHKCKDREMNGLLRSNLITKSLISWSQLRLVQKWFPEYIADFSNLESLNLNENSIEMYQNQLTELNFSELKYLCVSCDESTVFPNKVCERFKHGEKLEILKLNNCSYEEIFWCKDVRNALFFPPIKFLSLKSLDDLKRIWKRDYKLDSFENLESLKVSFCGGLISVLLPVPSSFRNLKILKVESCYKLVSLMVVSTATSLEQLEELEISLCGKMRQVVTDEETTDGVKDKKITFHKLKKLKLSWLYSLTSFVDGNWALEFLVLEELSISECPNMDIFTSGSLSTPMLREVSMDWEEYPCEDNLAEITKQHHEEKIFVREELAFKSIKCMLQTGEEVFLKLKSLSLRGEEMVDLQSQLPGQRVFPNLRRFQVFEDESTSSFPLSILKTFQTVVQLELNGCSYEEIFSSEDLDKYAASFARIEYLSVYGFQNLKQLWEHSSILQSNIGVLTVESCGSLVTLMPSSSSFQNLTELNVQDCDELLNVFEPATAKSLVQLQSLKIKNCKMTRTVLSSHKEVVGAGQIIFKRLWSLTLCNLSNLTSFSSQNATFTFPSLTRFVLKRCPKMKVFSYGILDTPKLHEVTREDTALDCYNNLNAIVEEIHRKEQENGTSTSQDSGGPSTFNGIN